MEYGMSHSFMINYNEQDELIKLLGALREKEDFRVDFLKNSTQHIFKYSRIFKSSKIF